MDVAPPSYCFVAFPPPTKDGRVVVGKNSARPRDEVQEVVYFAAATYDPGCKVECTYIEIDQVPKTNAVALSRPSWLWGAEMGANEHGLFIANEAVLAREAAPETEALLGMDLVRLGLERGSTAKEALDVIVSLLEEYGQGGNYYEDGSMCQTFMSAYLIVDRKEAWVLDTIGKYWAAEKITDGVKCICNCLSLTTKIDAEHPKLRSYAESKGWWSTDKEFNFAEVFSQDDDCSNCSLGKEILKNQEANITVETMIDLLRNKAEGISVDSDSFLTTASMVSILPQNLTSPCIHFFTGTPDPSKQKFIAAALTEVDDNLNNALNYLEKGNGGISRIKLCFLEESCMPRANRSIFKPFIFVDGVKIVPKVQSPIFGSEDPVKKIPRFQEKPDRRHELYKAQQQARLVLDSDEEKGHTLRRIMLNLEKQGLEAMEGILSSSEILDSSEIEDLFYDCVDTEIKFFK